MNIPRFVTDKGERGERRNRRINLDCVHSMVQERSGNWRCYDADNGVLGHISDDAADVPVVIPNHAPIVLLEFGDGFMQRHHVIGFQVHVAGFTEPIVASGDDLFESVFCYEQRFALSGGGESVTYDFPHDRCFDSFEDARAYAELQVKAKEDHHAAQLVKWELDTSKDRGNVQTVTTTNVAVKGNCIQ